MTSASLSSWGNPWSERLPTASLQHRRSMPNCTTYDPDLAIDYHEENQTQHAHTSHSVRRLNGSEFPSTKRSGWFSFIPSTLRPAVRKQQQQQLLSFESLTKVRCFGEILIRLSDDGIDKAQWLQCRGYESPLHLLLQYKPPLLVVETVIYELKLLGQKCPEALCDSKGRSSVHIACAAVPSNHVAVIARLINGLTTNPTTNHNNPAAMMDTQKMTPLHYACQGKFTKCDVENNILIIRFLTECYPQGVLLRNNRGLTPSDLVRKGRNNPEIMMILYQVTVDLRMAAAANALTTAVDKHHVDTHPLNKGLVQKYIKSEHQLSDKLAAFVESNRISTYGAAEETFACDFENDNVSDFESMGTFAIHGDTSTTANDANSHSENNPQTSGNKKDNGKAKSFLINNVDDDEMSDSGSLYTFGNIDDDYSVLVEDNICDTSTTVNDTSRSSKNKNLSHLQGNKNNKTGKAKSMRLDNVDDDEMSDLGSQYNFGIIDDDNSMLVEDNICSPSQEDYPRKSLPNNNQHKSEQDDTMDADDLDAENVMCNEATPSCIVSTYDNSVVESVKHPNDSHLADESHLIVDHVDDSNSMDDTTLIYSNSDTYDEVDVTEFTTTTLMYPSLSKYFGTQKSVQPLQSSSLDVDTSSISYTSVNIDTPSLSGTDQPGSDSSQVKKIVQFNDRVQIYKFVTLCSVDMEKELLDHTDPTESETSMSSSSNPLDDSDRGDSGSIAIISETNGSSSLLMQRYGEHYYETKNEKMVPERPTFRHDRQNKGSLSMIETKSMYFV